MNRTVKSFLAELSKTWLRRRVTGSPAPESPNPLPPLPPVPTVRNPPKAHTPSRPPGREASNM